MGYGTDKSRFLLKVRHFLTQHLDHIAIQKLRRNEQLTPMDLTELERIFRDQGVASDEDLVLFLKLAPRQIPTRLHTEIVQASHTDHPGGQAWAGGTARSALVRG